MAEFGGGRIHANPKTDSQLRAALAAAQLQTDVLQEQIDDLTTAIEEIDAQSGPVSAIFDSTAAIGQPVYVPSTGHVDLANANAAATAGVAGIVSTGASAAATGEYITAGHVTQADWTAVTGSVSLTAGSVYYLNTTSGLLTTTPSSTRTHWIVRCGRALTTTTFDVKIEPGVLL